MRLLKLFTATVLLLIITSKLYSQEGYYVDKDYRIKKYQLNMVRFLVQKELFSDNNLSLRQQFNSMFVYKAIDLFPWTTNKSKPSILIVKFGVLGDDIPQFWAILENNSRFFFANTVVPNRELATYIEKYDKVTRDIILMTLKYYKPYE